ncbi:hypothetical protein AEAC466_03495 [Asticcacaulis sp. AC466]|uniref:EF-hand domain-containing protein n=1 Tax=Asticcacaulis sp. AC466 TaxID=1282362 RepID=UPI0003C4099F|nr:EF-hand domain-containing protein [Asticcacaulis sp. AC466]ESQ86274.1 hypothetical protein AEAC466_03495 [Asticcacaulis sp. AC466]
MSRISRFSSALIAGVFALTAIAAHAQTGEGRGGRGGMLERYDTDKDGKVSLAEYEAGRQNQFRRIDTDGNGALSFAEIDAAGAEAAQRGGGMAQMMQQRLAALKAADTNGDSSVSAAEYKAYVDAAFKALDKNNDGFVTADEFQAAMPGR